MSILRAVSPAEITLHRRNYGYADGHISRSVPRTFYNYVSWKIKSAVKGYMNVKIFQTGRFQITGCKGDEDIARLKEVIQQVFEGLRDSTWHSRVTRHPLLPGMYVDQAEGVVYEEWGDKKASVYRPVGKFIDATNMVYQGKRVTVRENGDVVFSKGKREMVLFHRALHLHPPDSNTLDIEVSRDILHEFDGWKWHQQIACINAMCPTKTLVDKSRLVSFLRSRTDLMVSYDPVTYMGVNVKMFDPDSPKKPLGTILVVSTGLIWFCGFKDMEVMREKARWMSEIVKYGLY